MKKDTIFINQDKELVRKLIEDAGRIAGYITYASGSIDKGFVPTAQITSFYINLIVQTIFAKIVPSPADIIYFIPCLWERMEQDIQEFTTLDKSWIKKARLVLAREFNKLADE